MAGIANQSLFSLTELQCGLRTVILHGTLGHHSYQGIYNTKYLTCLFMKQQSYSVGVANVDEA